MQKSLKKVSRYLLILNEQAIPIAFDVMYCIDLLLSIFQDPSLKITIVCPALYSNETIVSKVYVWKFFFYDQSIIVKKHENKFS
jgi:hypothetical protein